MLVAVSLVPIGNPHSGTLLGVLAYEEKPEGTPALMRDTAYEVHTIADNTKKILFMAKTVKIQRFQIGRAHV